MTPKERPEIGLSDGGVDYSNGRWKLLERWMEQILGQVEAVAESQKELRKESDAHFAKLREEISQLRDRVKGLEIKEGFHAGKWQTVFLVLSPIITGIVVGLILWLVTKGAKADAEEIRGVRAPGDRGGVERVLRWPEDSPGIRPGGAAGDRRVVPEAGPDTGGRI